MCVIVFKPAGAEVSEEVLRQCWNANEHGAGIAYAYKDQVHISKGHMKWDDFLDALKAIEVKVRSLKETPIIFHFRIRTHGTRDKSNTHPFKVRHGAMAHNGTIPGFGSHGVGESDTADFCNTFGRQLSRDVVIACKDELQRAIGGSKLCFLYDGGHHVILNELLGTWRDGCWFSNIYWDREYNKRTPREYDEWFGFAANREV